MPILSNPAWSSRLAVGYITGGTLIDVWCLIWYTWLKAHPPESDASYFWCAGLALTGLTLVIIGLALGRIGRSAREAELPPPEATPQAVVADTPVDAQGLMQVAPTQAAAPVATPVILPQAPQVVQHR
ncbi:MAG: hypothetical protein JNM56_19685 [Planctomycetia bacterium]|nr:hypothetical protein [Planctomycetia bacterium]